MVDSDEKAKRTHLPDAGGQRLEWILLAAREHDQIRDAGRNRLADARVVIRLANANRRA
ncbi:MAG: hypothetical protein K0Q64_2433 [Nitrobacter vulgaris]|nr:hypothetical protein [Nitrobacter vulgaris]